MEAAKWPAHAFQGNAQALISSTVGDRYNEIHAPVLIIHGDHVAPAPLTICTTSLLEALPNAVLEVMPNVRHFRAVEALGPVSHSLAALLGRSCKLNEDLEQVIGHLHNYHTDRLTMVCYSSPKQVAGLAEGLLNTIGSLTSICGLL